MTTQTTATTAESEQGTRATPASRFPIADFCAAMEAGDVDRALENFTDDCLLRPLGTDHLRFEGKEATRDLVRAVLQVFERTNYHDRMLSDDEIWVRFKTFPEGIPFDGIDCLKIDENGKCYQMDVMGRPQFAQTIFTGKVALRLRPQIGWFRKLLLTVLIPPLEWSQKLAARLGPWLIQPGVPTAVRQRPE